jgi:toxin YoeB
MGKFTIQVEKLAQDHLNKHIKSGDKASIKKIEKIFVELSQTPYSGIGNPEPLKHELTGFWSRRINTKDRIIYKVQDDIVTVFVISAMCHYDK